MTKGGVSSCASYVCQSVVVWKDWVLPHVCLLICCFSVECFHHFRNRVSIRAWFWHVRLIDLVGEIHSPRRTHPLTLDGWKTTCLMGCTVFSGYVSFKEWCSRINPAYTEICTCLCILCLKHVSNIVGSDETQVYVYIYTLHCLT